MVVPCKPASNTSVSLSCHFCFLSELSFLLSVGRCHCLVLESAICWCWLVLESAMCQCWCWKVPCVNVGAGKCHKMYASHCLCQVHAHFCLSQAISAEDTAALEQLQAMQAQDINLLVFNIAFWTLHNVLRLRLKEHIPPSAVPGHHIVACQCICALCWDGKHHSAWQDSLRHRYLREEGKSLWEEKKEATDHSKHAFCWLNSAHSTCLCRKEKSWDWELRWKGQGFFL